MNVKNNIDYIIKVVSGDQLRKLMIGSGREDTNIDKYTTGFIAVENNFVVGLAVLVYNCVNNVFILHVLKTDHKCVNKGIGSALLFATKNFAISRGAGLVAKFNSKNHVIDTVLGFYNKNGYYDIHLNTYQFVIKVKNWINIFERNYYRDADVGNNLEYKTYNRLNCDELHQLEFDYNHIETYLHPFSYPGEYRNDFSIYVVNGNRVWGWNVAKLENNSLTVYCSYVAPEKRNEGIGLRLWKFMCSDKYYCDIEKLDVVNFYLDSDNNYTNKLFNTICRNKLEEKIEHYIIDIL